MGKIIRSALLQLLEDDDDDDYKPITESNCYKEKYRQYLENKIESMEKLNGTHFFNSQTMDFPARSKFIDKFGKDYSNLHNITGASDISMADILCKIHECFGTEYSITRQKTLSFQLDRNEIYEIDAQYRKRYDRILTNDAARNETFAHLDNNSYIENDDIVTCIIFEEIPIGIVIHSQPFDQQHAIKFFYIAQHDFLNIQETIDLFTKNIYELCKERHDNKIDDDFNSEFQLITKTQKGYSTMSFDFDYEKYNNFDLSKNYNDSIIPVSEKIVKHLNKHKSSGITILHGTPGTGKTTYLRYLVSVLRDKEIIYLPPDMTNILSDPSIIDFMKAKTNSIFIIEDGEEVLKKRGENGNTTAVSNMLNVSDGLLADVLHFNFVITINCDIDQIDPALRRPGRLVAEYQFERLTPIKSKKLLMELYPDLDIPDVNAMTLAEIYTYGEDKFTHTKKKNGVGFTADIYG